jgi:hypothetical protein
LALKFDFAVPRDDGEGTCAVLVQFGIGNSGNFGNTTVGGFEDVPCGLPFERVLA